MKQLLLRLAIGVPAWFMWGSSAMAMCIWFAPPARQFEPATNIQILLQRRDTTSNLIVQPQFSGDADDFALVMPFPDEPALSSADPEIFNDLEDLTNPVFDFEVATLETDALSRVEENEPTAVRVIKVETVGDYSATTLEASDASALTEWLTDNGYEITSDKQATLDQYIADDSAVFVALKVAVDSDAIDDNGLVEGGLDPIQFTFEAESAVLPFRLMAGESNLMTITVYSLANELMYIPGAEIQFSRRVTATDIKSFASLEALQPREQWLARNVIQFDPAEVTQDTELLTTSDIIIVDANSSGVHGTSVVIDPDKLPGESGLLVSERGEIIYSNEAKQEEAEQHNLNNSNTPSMLWLVTIGLGISNIALLRYIKQLRDS